MTFYKDQWLKLLDTSAEIPAFIVANEGHSASFIVVPDRLGILVNSTLFLLEHSPIKLRRPFAPLFELSRRVCVRPMAPSPEAPVGHRQPRASDVPNETSDVPNEKNLSSDPFLTKENAMLDKKMKSICRGC